jgi:hypothetical protein
MATRADKKHTVATAGLNRFLEHLRTLRQDNDEVPDGWFSMRQFVEQTGLSRPYCNQLLVPKIGKGVEMRMFKIQTAFGIKHIPHYRIHETARG